MRLSIKLPLIVCTFTFAGPLAAQGNNEVSPAQRDEQGFLAHAVKSAYQGEPTDIRVLLPDTTDNGKRYPVVYVLPVEGKRGARYGDGLQEVQKHDLHNKCQTIFVAPSFSHLPWYADHPTSPEIRQESYFLKVVVPFIDKTYPTSSQRYLLGFSKSGWGAWSLLLRHPDTFQRAAAWDAPLMMQQIGKYGTSSILGTQENFEKYRPTDLLKANANMLQSENRLILTGYGSFQEQHIQTHNLLENLKISHTYRDGPQRKHDWHSGWVPEAVELLLTKPITINSQE